MPARTIPEPPEPFTDGTITLRLQQERDIPEVLVAFDNDQHLHADRGLKRPPSGAELGRALEEAPQRRAAGIDETLSILDGSGRFAGELIVHSIDWDDRRAELGLWLVPAMRGQGIGRRALALGCAWLLRDWQLDRLQLVTATRNAAMLACARAAGFEQEGVLRGHTVRDGVPEDDLILSLLAGDSA
jgi:RimJ/RimL family protein N-acetyltransferase